MFVDANALIKVQVSVAASQGTIGFVDRSLLTNHQSENLLACSDRSISELPQDLRLAILSQAIASGVLKITISTSNIGE